MKTGGAKRPMLVDMKVKPLILSVCQGDRTDENDEVLQGLVPRPAQVALLHLYSSIIVLC